MRIFQKISIIIDIILLAIFAFVAFLQVSIVVSKNNNHGVASILGKSVLYVSTDSMYDPEAENCLSPGTGLVIEKINPEDLKPSTPIYDDEGILVDYQKDGDIVTFYCPGSNIVNTHRVAEKNYIESEGKYYFITMGDNPLLHHLYLAEMWDESLLVGKVVNHSKSLGSFLEISSPEAAAYLSSRTGSFHFAWFFPILMMTPALIFLFSHIGQYYIYKTKNDEKNDKK